MKVRHKERQIEMVTFQEPKRETKQELAVWVVVDSQIARMTL